ncbi:hypothetical protein SDC9_45770 [bioreactor metagenome]|uniref:Uncharacterized protein n=1 Tax=bioreactor metagenome TaxID=1076179 RepID=A0A644WAF8_9ZZZZ|nr:hypothetical protein [Desulfitobacterium hafniense]MEA5025899.1 hypothetical protein [Desulfitobacterium hafniense]
MLGGKLIHCQKVLEWYTFTLSFTLRLAADSINDELEFRLIIAAIIKSIDENDWDSARKLFLEKVATYRNLGQKRVERIKQHTNVEILRGDVSVSISLKDLVKIVLK